MNKQRDLVVCLSSFKKGLDVDGKSVSRTLGAEASLQGANYAVQERKYQNSTSAQSGRFKKY